MPKRWDGAPNLRFQPIPPSFHRFWHFLAATGRFSPFLTISHLHHETPREAHCVEGHPPSSQGPLSLLPQTASAPLDPPRIGQGLTVNRHQHTLEFAHPNTQKYHENIWNLQIQPPQNDGIQQKIGSGDPKMNEYTTKTSVSVGLVYIIWREGISIPNLDKDDKAEICMKSEETICFTLQNRRAHGNPMTASGSSRPGSFQQAMQPPNQKSFRGQSLLSAFQANGSQEPGRRGNSLETNSTLFYQQNLGIPCNHSDPLGRKNHPQMEQLDNKLWDSKSKAFIDIDIPQQCQKPATLATGCPPTGGQHLAHMAHLPPFLLYFNSFDLRCTILSHQPAHHFTTRSSGK